MTTGARAGRPARPGAPDRITARLAATLRVEFGEEARQRRARAGPITCSRPLNSKGDNPKARQALLHTIDQTAILQAIGAPAENTRPFCGSFLMCGTPLETSAGTAGSRSRISKAKALLKEAGYDGRPVIFMQPSDLNANFNATVVVAEAMRKAGFKVDIQPVEIGHMRGGSP